MIIAVEFSLFGNLDRFLEIFFLIIFDGLFSDGSQDSGFSDSGEHHPQHVPRAPHRDEVEQAEKSVLSQKNKRASNSSLEFSPFGVRLDSG